MRDKIQVYKFGGSCLKNRQDFDKVISIIQNYNPDIIVVSAINGVTDKLINLYNNNEGLGEIIDIHNQISSELGINNGILLPVYDMLENKEEYDYCDVIKLGEYLSERILKTYAGKKGLPVIGVETGEEDGVIKTNNNSLDSILNKNETSCMVNEKLVPLMKNKTLIVTGFSGNYEGKTTLLGREGSDATAISIAYSLNKDSEVVLWKDNLMMTADPKIVSDVKIIKNLNYKEARFAAFGGAKILHPLCIPLAEEKGIKILIRDFKDPYNGRKTIISNNREKNGHVLMITGRNNIGLITVEGLEMYREPGYSGRIHKVLGENNISVIGTNQSSMESDIEIMINKNSSEKAVRLINEELGSEFSVNLDKNKCIAAVILRESAKNTPGIASDLTEVFRENNINIRLITGGKNGIDYIINCNDYEKVLNSLHNKAFINI